MKSTSYFNLMDIKLKIYSFVIVGISLIFIGCPKECVSPERSYIAEFNIEKKSETLKVGDTLWISSVMDCNSMFNYVTSSMDQFCEQTFSNTLYLNQMVDSLQPLTSPAVKEFDYSAIHGRIYNDKNVPSPDRVNQLEFSRVENKYLLQVGLICKTAGTFYISISPGGSFENNQCDRSSLDIHITNSNRSFEIYEAYITPRIMTDYEKKYFYVFEVK